MPNYAWNHMSMKASDYKKYVEGIDEEGNPTVDFNVLLPMPKSYEGIPSGIDTDMAFICYISNKFGKDWPYVAEQINELLPNTNKYKSYHYKYAYDRLSSRDDLDALYSRGEQIVENIKNYGAVITGEQSGMHSMLKLKRWTRNMIAALFISRPLGVRQKDGLSSFQNIVISNYLVKLKGLTLDIATYARMVL